MQFVWSDLIARARTYVDDDHEDQPGGGWIKPERWLLLGNVEYAQLRKKWIRTGLVTPTATDTAFTDDTASVTGVLCTIGVAEDLGNGDYRVLQDGQPLFGSNAFYRTGDGYPAYYETHGEADSLTYTLKPPPTSGSFIVRTIGTVAYATSTAATIDLPYGGDEVLVLGMAKRAHVKDSGGSRNLEMLLKEANEEMVMGAVGRNRNDSPRARRTPRTSTSDRSFPTDPAFWRWR